MLKASGGLMSNSKWIRAYTLFIDFEGESLRFDGSPKSQLRLTFSAEKSKSGGLNKAELDIFNLNREHREKLQKSEEENKRIFVRLDAGYQDNLSTIFTGHALTASSQRDFTDFVTQMVIYDGGHDERNTIISKSTKTANEMVDAVINAMPNTKRGLIESLPDNTKHQIIVDSPFNALKLLAKSGAKILYIDDGQVFVQGEESVRSSYIALISAKTGLINTPVKSQGIITFSTKIDPQIKIGNKIKLESQFNPSANGEYFVRTIRYIGDYYGDDWTQEIEVTRKQSAAANR